MAADALHLHDLRADADLLAEQLYDGRAFEQDPAQGALRLIADEQDRGFRPPEIMLQMMADPARFAHSAGGNNHLWFRILIDPQGFFT